MSVPLSSLVLYSARVLRGDESVAIEAANQYADSATRAQIVAEIEALDDDGKWLAKIDAQRKLVKSILNDRLLALLGDGEVEPAPSGRVAYRGRVSGGRKSVNETAIVERREEFPPDLRPEQVWKLPTVGALEKAVRDDRIPLTLAAAVIDEPKKVPGLRWATVGEMETAS